MSVTAPDRLMRATDVVGLPVVTIGGGDDICEIRDVVYDANNHTLIGFTLNKRGWFRGTVKGVLAATDIEAIGADPAAVGYELADAQGDSVFVPISAQMAVSDTNLILPEESTEFVRNDLAGFGASITEFRSDLDAASDDAEADDTWKDQR